MNSKVTVFKDLYDLKNPKYVDVSYVLKKIEDQSVKDLVDKIRSEKDKSVRNQIKKRLPCVLFSGEFSERSDNAMIKHSGLICLDFDGFETIQELDDFRLRMINDSYSYSVFLSPSGDGLKVLVKIPEDKDNHRSYFNALKEYFNSPHFDESCVNESRICYMSSDLAIYINENSYVFDKKSKVKETTTKEFKIDVRDDDKIITGLMKWWESKYGLVEGERNRNVYILSMAFNEFGISEIKARSFMSQFAHSGFDNNEISNCVESAYRKSHLFNTKSFSEDVKFEDYSPSSMEAKDENKVLINVHNIYESSFVDVTKKIEQPPIAISIGSRMFRDRSYPIPFGTYGNFSCLVGPSKSKKSFLKSLIVASYIGGDTSQYASSIKPHRDRDCYVIDIDTEQSMYDAQKVFKRTMKLVGRENYEYYKPFALRPYEPKQRIEFIEWLIYESELKDNIGFISIDGLADLVDDFNDLKESQKVIQKVMKWTDDKQFHLTTILHSNYGTAKAVGHIGSSVLKKAETICYITNNGEYVTASFPQTRGYPIEDFSYAVNDMDLPYLVRDQLNKEDVKRIHSQSSIPETNVTIEDAFDLHDEIPF